LFDQGEIFPFSLLLPVYAILFLASEDVLHPKLTNLLMGIAPLKCEDSVPSFIMAQLFMTVQNLDNDTKYLDRTYNEDDPYAMVSVNQYFELHGKICGRRSPVH